VKRGEAARYIGHDSEEEVILRVLGWRKESWIR
jgi:hypothetical protein